MSDPPAAPGAKPRPAYLANLSWLTADHLVRLVLGFAVNIWVVRYLGAEQYGLLSYALGLVALVSPLGILGLDVLLVRKLALREADPGALLGTAFALKLGGAGVGVLLVLFDIQFVGLEGAGPLAAIIVLGSLFQGIGVIDLYFQSEVASRHVVLARQAQVWVGAGLRIALIWFGAGLVWFAWLVVVEAMLLAVGLVLTYVLRGAPQRWRFKAALARALLRESWPLFASILAITVQARIGLILLAKFAGPAEVAQYAIALRLVELFAFVPNVMHSTFAPALAQAWGRGEAAFGAYLTDLNGAMLWVGIGLGLPLVLTARWLVPWLYGDAFAAAGLLLAILALSIPLDMMRGVRRLFVVNAGLQVYALVSALIAAIISIPLTWWLVAHYQAMGAVLAQLVGVAIAVVGIDLFYVPARVNLRALVRAALMLPDREALRRLVASGPAIRS